MRARLRLATALSALAAAVIVVCQNGPNTGATHAGAPDSPMTLRMTNVSTTIKWPVIETTDPSPFDPCRDIPLDVIQRIGLAYTPPTPEDSLRCKYDAGNYQMAVEAFVWRTYEETIPADAVEFDVDGHRAAQYWVMKPTDWNDRWWTTCMMAFKTSFGVIQQSLFYSPIHSPDRPDCLQTNLQRAHQLAPYYKF